MKITFFAPFAQITVHNLAEIKLAEILIDLGHEVDFIQCDKTFINQCTVLDANGIGPTSTLKTKEKLCSECISQRDNYRKIPKINYISTKQLEVDSQEVIIPKDIASMIDFELGGIKIGKIASFESLIKFKKSNFEFNLEQTEHLRSWLKSAVNSYYVANKYFELYDTDLVLIYSPQYNINGVFSEVALSLGKRTLFIDGSGNDSERYSHIRIYDWDVYGLREPALFHLNQFRDYIPTTKALNRAKRQAEEFPKTKSFNAYSQKKQKKNTFDFFNLDKKKKLMLVAMSSYDEVFSGVTINRLAPARFQGNVFRDQIEWIEHIIEWAKLNPNIQVIIRPHPREFPNRRDRNRADHTDRWINLFSHLPDNIKVDRPELKFSIYDHFDSIDALTTGWSTAGLIALIHQIPVVSYDSEIVTFPHTIHFSGNSKLEYDKNLSIALEHGKDPNLRSDAIKWLAFLLDIGTLKITHRIGDSIGNLFIRKLINSKYLNYFRTKVEYLIPPSKKDSARIEEMMQGGNSLFIN